ncbi:hypothetical protein D3C81_1018970 [compost metagenome]
MSDTSRDTVLCRYRYDPLDRQNGCTVLEQPAIQRFHCKSRLTTEIQGAARWSIVQHNDQLLAQQNRLDAKVSTTLLATDLQRSVLNALDATQPNNPLAYTPYGHRPAGNRLLSLLGFNGERPDPVTGHYHLGNGYRQFNPVLMRFNSPDSWSPFGEGGLNTYGYCDGDPVNRADPTGHAWGPLKALRRINILKKKTRIPKEMENYAFIKKPKTSFDKKVAKQIDKDFKKGKPSAEKVQKREDRYWKTEIQKTGKTPDELIAQAKERFEKNRPPDTSPLSLTHVVLPSNSMVKSIGKINDQKKKTELIRTGSSSATN